MPTILLMHWWLVGIGKVSGVVLVRLCTGGPTARGRVNDYFDEYVDKQMHGGGRSLGYPKTTDGQSKGRIHDVVT
jgi:hypothetical protein